MNRFATAFMCGLFILCLEISSFAQGPSYDLSVGIGKLDGDTTYQIGGKVTNDSIHGNYVQHDPTSELEFPLDVYMLSVEGNVHFSKKWHLAADIKRNITSDAGHMKDSDWGISWEYPQIGSGDWEWYGPDSLDIYSESDSDLDAWMLGVKLRYRFYEYTTKKKADKLHLLGGIGYLYQNFDYECKLIRQLDLRADVPDDQNQDYVGNGQVALTYEVTYNIFYLEIGAQYKSGKNSAEIFLGYSPTVNAEDEDNHLLRRLISKGDCDGEAFLFSLKGEHCLSERISINLQYDYLFIDTDGEQEYGGPDQDPNLSYQIVYRTGTIETEIESEQHLFLLAVRYSF